MEHVVFLTGRLAEANLVRVLEGIDELPFSWEVREIGLQVAALMTADMIQRRVAAPVEADRIIVPGRCRGDMAALTRHYGIPVERGPDELKDLPRHFDRAARAIDLSEHATAIFAEIVDAPQLGVDAIVARARALAREGADVIDLGCLPETPFEHLPDAVRALKAEGFAVSVDSVSADELLRGGRAGADYLLSLTVDTLWIADEVASTPVLIPQAPADEATLFEAIDRLQARGRRFLADPILDPIPFGLTASIVRYHRLRERYPQVAIMMGVGNLTELTEADTSGINALLFGIAAELGVAAVLTTQVSPHARRAVREADWARRIMHAAAQYRTLPKGLSDALMTVHAKRPFTDTADEIAAVAAQVRDPNFRVQVSSQGLHVYNRDGLRTGQGAFELWPQLRLEDDASHAFYMGVELAHAEIAWRLGKRYVQDQPLDWGCAVETAGDDKTAWCAPGSTMTTGRARNAAPGCDAVNDVIFETVVTTVAKDGAPHVAPMGVRYRGDGVVLMPFKPSTTLANILAVGRAVLNVVVDTRVFAGAVTGRRDWPLVAAGSSGSVRLACALSHVELALARVEEDPQRPVLHLDRIEEAVHAPFRGFNRAQAAVVEAAVLVSRLHMLPAAKIDAEMAYLRIAIEKTAGPEEHEAWGWLVHAIARHRLASRPAPTSPESV